MVVEVGGLGTFVHPQRRSPGCTEFVQKHVVSCKSAMHTDTTVPDDTRTLEDAVRTLDSARLAEQDLRDHTDDDAREARPREGLPKNYRSRHDRHYVEQLTSATGMPLLRMLAVSRIDAAHLPDPSEVTALAESIARVGVLQPLLVRAQGDRFVLIAGRKRLVAAREAHCREVPCLVHSADDARAYELAEAANATAGERRERVPQSAGDTARAECDALSETVLPEVQHALSSVQRSLRLLPQSPAATRERVAMRLIAAELERAQWLVQCRRYLAGRLSFTARPISTADLAKEFRVASTAIALHGGQLHVDTTGVHAMVNADAALLAASVHGLSWALLALGETAADPRVRVTVARQGADEPTVVSMGQPTAVLNQPALLRFFDAGWKARPGGAAAELAVQLARYAAARHGAELEVASGTTSGTTVTLTLR